MGPLSDGVSERMCVNGRTRSLNATRVCRANPVRSAPAIGSRRRRAVPINTHTTQWAIILDEAWDVLEEKPPKRIAIVVSDLPGDAEKRESTSI
jgi:hypothetical protein